MPRHERLPAYRVLSHVVVMIVVSVVLGVVVAGLAIPFAGIAGVGARNVARTMDDLPEELQIDDLSQRTTILDADGNKLASLYDENRITVPLKGVSRTMVKALVAIEDYRFYQHGALDLKGTLRALITNQANSGVVQGGSSITQQLVKLTLLSQAKGKAEKKAATEETYARKLKELRYAIALEQTHSKDWILWRYLNTAYFGDGAYGVQAAARHYFNVNARDLTLRQSAMLAGLVKNPSGYDPTNYPDRTIERRDVVLDRMAELNVIPREKAESVKLKDLGPQHPGRRQRLRQLAGAVLLRLRAGVAAPGPAARRLRPGAAQRAQERWSDDQDHRQHRRPGRGRQRRPGPRLRQGQRHRRAGGGRARHRQRAGARAVPADGRGPQARARPTSTTPSPRSSATPSAARPGRRSRRSPWRPRSSRGCPLTTSFQSNSPMTFNYDDYANCPGEPGFGYGTFEVPNSTTSGNKNMYSGTRESVNTYYMQLEQDTGVCAPYQLAQQMGVSLTNPRGDSQGNGAELIPNFTLGTASASPLEMAEAYATFAARGLHCSSRPVTQILDSAGNVVKDYPSQCQQVMEQQTADAVSDVLRGVLEGGFAEAQRLSVPAAGKTGTTNEGKSVWFIGYTPHIAAAVMLGGANQLGTPISLEGVSVGGNSDLRRVRVVLRRADLGRRDAGHHRRSALRRLRLPLGGRGRRRDLGAPAQAAEGPPRRRPRRRRRWRRRRQRQRQRRQVAANRAAGVPPRRRHHRRPGP